MGRTFRRAATLASMIALLTASGVTASSEAIAIRATLDGRPIPLSAVSSYDCHDRAFPLIHCFTTSAALAADEAATQSATPAIASTTAFVRWFADVNYGGPYFDAYFSYADLSTIGWNDRISSFYGTFQVYTPQTDDINGINAIY